jgi:carbon-monoxide dehydrogenase large subunit
MTAATGIGARVLRTEDKRFLTGTGRYVDDLPLARATYAYFLRSPHAHAKIKSIDISAAAKMPGRGQHLHRQGPGRRQGRRPDLRLGGQGQERPTAQVAAHPVMAVDTVRYVGDTVAMIVANSHDEAKDAAEAIKVDYDVKPATIDLATALDKGATEVHPRRRAISSTTGKSA